MKTTLFFLALLALNAFHSPLVRASSCTRDGNACVGQIYFESFNRQLAKVTNVSPAGTVAIEFLTGDLRGKSFEGWTWETFKPISRIRCTTDGRICRGNTYYYSPQNELAKVLAIVDVGSEERKLVLEFVSGSSKGLLIFEDNETALTALSRNACTSDKKVCLGKDYYDSRTDDLARVVAISERDEIVVLYRTGETAGKTFGSAYASEFWALKPGQANELLALHAKALAGNTPEYSRLGKELRGLLPEKPPAPQQAPVARTEADPSNAIGSGGLGVVHYEKPEPTKGACPSNWTSCPATSSAMPQIPASTRNGDIVYIRGYPYVYRGR